MAYKVDSADGSVTEPSRPAASSLKFFSDALRTRVSGWWLNMVQNEICSAVTKFGLTLDKTSDNQLGLAIEAGINTGLLASTNPFMNYALFQDEKASGIDGDPYPTANVWQKRTLIEKVNRISGCSIASSLITLPAGTYRVSGWSDTERTTNGVHITRCGVFQTDSGLSANLLAVGGNRVLYTDDRPGDTVQSSVVGEFTLVSSSTITMRDTISYANSDLGRPIGETGFPEVYCALEIWKLD